MTLLSAVRAEEAKEPAEAAGPDFKKEVQPLLASHCIKCHGEEKQKGGLRLDVKSHAFAGGDSGDAAVVAGKPEESRLIELVTVDDELQRMPPEGPALAAEQIDLLRRWIDAGAEWPEEGSAAPARTEMVVTDEDRRRWSFRPLQDMALPDVQDDAWVRTPVDRFILQAQKSAGIAPAEEADRRTLVRRLYFDLIGLPPTPEQIAAYVESDDPQAYEKLVDELLESDRYGERWARHWLDVARYADSAGQEGDADRPNAYRYRDFVIEAFNDDLPYDRFVRWQLAGDEIEPADPQAIAATGFIVAGNSTLLNVPMEEEKLRNRANELDDMVSTTGQAFLGLTLACARCHDHKYDPLPTRDYYRMTRIFNGGDRGEVPLASPEKAAANRKELAKWKSEVETLEDRRDDWLNERKNKLAAAVRAAKIEKLPVSGDEKTLLRDRPNDDGAKKLAEKFAKELKVEDGDCVAALPDDQRARWMEIEREIEAVESRKPKDLSVAFAFKDFGSEPRETWFFERGDFLARNEKMDFGFLSVLTKERPAEEYWTSARESKQRDDSTQQRRALAEWMTDVAHGAGPLVARVMVNRVWQHHFGEGLVRTVSDFGTRGEQPSHPELLEWLASEFVRDGWSVKNLHRLIVNSAAYRQGAAPAGDYTAIDPENRLLWRRRPQRLEAEAIRDAMLAVAGTLNDKMFGPGVKAPIMGEAMQARNVKDPYPRDVKDTPETRRRSVYLFHKRVVQYPLMQAFDAPDAQVSCGRRVNTTVAPQALALLNDPFVRRRAEELSERLAKETGDDVDAQIRRAFELGLWREPSAEELADASSFLTEQTAARRERKQEEAERLALTDFCQALFSLNEFVYID